VTNIDLTPRQMQFVLPTANVDGTLAPLDFAHAVLAAELADALIDMRRAMGHTDGTAYQYRRALMSLLRGLPDACPRTVSLATPGLALIDALHAWESALAGNYPPESAIPYKYGRQIRALVRVHAANGRDVSDATLRWAQAHVLHQGGDSAPLDEFSNAERLAIRNACRARIRELEARLAVGRRLLANATDPRSTGWERSADVLWGIRHLGRRPGASIEADVLRACASGVLSDLHDDFALEQSPIRANAGQITRQLLTHIYPSSEDLVAFRTLLQLESGAAPEEWSGVRLTDIEHTTDSVRVRLHKARAHRTRTVRCAITGSRDGTGWRAGDLILRLIAVTEAAREEAKEVGGSDADALFITVQRTASRHLVARQESFSRRPFTSLLMSISPEISKPYDSRRLRKTVKSVRAAVLRSADAAAGDDHSIAVYQRHYAQSTTVQVLAGNAVNAAQSQVFHRVRGPVFVRAAASTVDDAAGDLGAAAAAELASSATDQGINVTQCTSPYESPFTPAGRLCEHRPSMCFACPNAIVFADHLPRVLAYREILRGHENEMPPAQFAAVHGQQLVNVERILHEFSPTEIENARTACETASVHVPLTQRGVHL